MVCVFDGKKLLAKKETNDKRRQGRDEALRKARESLASGDGKHYNFFVQAIRITQEMNKKIFDQCEKWGLKCVVAPYEADSELAYLARNNLVDFVMTEDSDLFIYGAKNLLIKLDDNSYCKLACDGKIDQVSDLDPFQTDRLLWLRYACIMQGCDYYPKGLKGLGIKTAIKLLKTAKEAGATELSQILNNMRKYGISEKWANKWTAQDIAGVRNAEECFRHQIIFNINEKRFEPLEPYPPGKTSSDFPHCGDPDDHELPTQNVNIQAVKSENKKDVSNNTLLAQIQRHRQTKRKSDSGSVIAKKARDDSWKIDPSRLSLGNSPPKMSEDVRKPYKPPKMIPKVESKTPKRENTSPKQNQVARLSESSDSELEFEKLQKEYSTQKSPKAIVIKPNKVIVKSQYFYESSSDSDIENLPKVENIKKKKKTKHQLCKALGQNESIEPKTSSFDDIFMNKPQTQGLSNPAPKTVQRRKEGGTIIVLDSPEKRVSQNSNGSNSKNMVTKVLNFLAFISFIIFVALITMNPNSKNFQNF
jgi:exonuclease-1